MTHDISLNTKAGDIKMATGLLMVYTAFLSASDIYPASRVLSPVF